MGTLTDYCHRGGDSLGSNLNGRERALWYEERFLRYAKRLLWYAERLKRVEECTIR